MCVCVCVASNIGDTIEMTIYRSTKETTLHYKWNDKTLPKLEMYEDIWPIINRVLQSNNLHIVISILNQNNSVELMESYRIIENNNSNNNNNNNNNPKNDNVYLNDPNMDNRSSITSNQSDFAKKQLFLG